VHGRDGKPEDHIALHRQILRDSRIPPAGFHPTPVTQIIGPITFSAGAGGVATYDDATFHVTLPNAVGTDAKVRVRLFFQAMTAHHVAALAAANTTDDRGTQLMQLWQQSGKAAPFQIAEAMQTVKLVAPPPDDAGCGCATARSSTTGGVLAALAALALAAAHLRRERRR
jgi:MYXO-CTERM domain-containing protein